VGDENISNGTLCEVRLNVLPNEASGLLSTENDALLEAHEWDCALWTVLGEGGIQECTALLGHEHGANMNEGWQTVVLEARLKDEDVETEDSETIARYDG